jgi:hypothetical protein
VNYVKRNGKVAVLISRGFGAGWSTWNPEHPEMLYDPDVVALLEAQPQLSSDAKEAAVSALLNDLARYPGAYFGGADGLYIHWIPSGARFKIDEYDGSESLILVDSDSSIKETP